MMEEHIQMDQLDQGTVLFGFRSEKYPGVPCYGTTASCDIANNKVCKLYYLIGVEARQWFCTEHSYRIVYKEKRENLVGQLRQKFQDASLNLEALQNFSEEEVNFVIEQEVSKQKVQDNLKKIYREHLLFCKQNMNSAERKIAIQVDSNPAVKFLCGVEKGEIFHYYYLPEKAYLKNNEMNAGLIIDLQEIVEISMEDAKRIITPGIDNWILQDEDAQECARLRRLFWLEEKDDFVGIEGEISSPWREHLMQRFSHDFARIGLDGAKKSNYVQLLKNI